MRRAACTHQLLTRRGGGLLALFGCAVLAGCNTTVDAAPVRRDLPRPTGLASLPVRGTLHTVRMLLDDEGFRFEPAYLTVRQGDGVEFRMISGVPHNVTFDDTLIPAGARAQLAANLAVIGARELAAPVVTAPDSTYVVSTSGLPPGDYLYFCAPHRSLYMHGVITVR